MGRMSPWFQESIFRKCLNVLSARDQKKIFTIVFLQIISGFFDLIAISIIGLLASLSVSGVQSQSPSARVSSILDFLRLSELNFQNQVLVLGLLAALILIGRTVFSVVFTRKAFYFLSRRGAQVSSLLISKTLNQSLEKLQRRTTQDNVYAVTGGVAMVTLGVLGSAVMIISDASLLLIIVFGLFLFDPLIALSTIVLFGSIGFALHRIMSVKAQDLGRRNAELTVKSSEKIIEALNSYRELVVRNRRGNYVKDISAQRLTLANLTAEIQFLPSVSKYVIETAIVIGAIFVSGLQFLLQDATEAVSSLAIFLAAGSRIAPAVMRLQQGLLQMKSSIGAASITLELMDDVYSTESLRIETSDFSTDHSGFTPLVEFKSLSFSYLDEVSPALKNVDLLIQPGQVLSIVGPSGAGKTTLVDLLLGVLEPSTGSVLISNHPPLDAVAGWPGAIAYVPQEIVIINSTIKANVGLGFSDGDINEAQVWEALTLAHLSDFVKGLPSGLETSVGENGSKLSGGQRQRLGIARALFTKPYLLVLDEATSSLDGETEAGIIETILSLKDRVTVVTIAHRLSTVRNSDRVIYLENGQILADGRFEEVMERVPNFDHQAKLYGF
jgi:ABC-type multidrug transport system fused ATPase/permease subunit